MGSRGGRDCGSWILEGSKASSTDCNSIFTGIFTGRTDAEAEAPTLWPPDVKSQLTGKDPWCWERLRAGGERGDRGWDGWMASSTQWTWVCANSRRQWRTGKPGMLQSMGLQRVGHDMTEQLDNNNIRRYLNCLQVTKTRNYAVRCLIGSKAAEGKREVSAKEDEDGSKTVVRPACSLC